MDALNDIYPGLDSPASELSAFAASTDFFTISLKDGKIIHFSPESKEDFMKWLVSHSIRNIRKELSNDEILLIASTDKSSNHQKGFFKCKKHKK